MKSVALIALLAYFINAAPVPQPLMQFLDPADQPIPAEFDSIVDGYIKPEIVKLKSKLAADCGPAPAPPRPPTPSGNVTNACDLYRMGFTKFGNKVNRQVFQGLQDAMADKFLAMLATQVQSACCRHHCVPAHISHFLDIIWQVHVPAPLQSAWVKAVMGITKADMAPALFTSVLCAPKKKHLADSCQFILLMGKHNSGVKKSDVVVIQVDASFGLNPTVATAPIMEVNETSKKGNSFQSHNLVPPPETVSLLMDEYMTYFQTVAYTSVVSA